MKAKLFGIAIVAVALVAIGGVLGFGRANGKKTTAPQDPAAWAARIQQIKSQPFADLEVVGENQTKMVVRCRIFKPTIDLLAIPGEPANWQKDPLDSFLRFSYTLYCDPNPSYDKYSQSFSEGKKYLDDKFRKLPKCANDEKGFFNNIRSSIIDMQLLGEVICDSVHMFVFAFESSDHKHGCGGVTMIIKDGKFYNDPDAKGRYEALINMSANKYREITKHFSKYQPKDDE